jgi:dUTP pyrophosphatase
LNKFKKISKKQLNKDFKEEVNLIKPKRGTALSAGYDFFNPYKKDIVIYPSETINIPTGFKIMLNKQNVLLIAIRSSLGFKYNIRLVNQLGVIDSDYYNNESNEGHIWVKIKNEGDKKVVIKSNEAIAQGIITKFLLVEGDNLEGKKRVGGIGSTNKESSNVS